MPGWRTPYGQYINPIDREIYPEGRPAGNNRRSSGFKLIAKERLRVFAERHLRPHLNAASVDFLVREGNNIIKIASIRSESDEEIVEISDKIIEKWILIRQDLNVRRAHMKAELASDFLKI